MNTLDVRTIEPKVRHQTIFEAFDLLAKGESLSIVNDHDPKPLQYQFSVERPEMFDWKYIESGPKLWRVEIKKLMDSAESEKVGCCGCSCKS